MQQHEALESHVKVVCAEANFFLRNCMPDASIDVTYINFPEPYNTQPKHRLIQLSLVVLLAQKMKQGGVLYVATDDYSTCVHTLSIMWDVRELWKTCWESQQGFRTTFEEEYSNFKSENKKRMGGYEEALKEMGRTIYYMKFQRY